MADVISSHYLIKMCHFPKFSHWFYLKLALESMANVLPFIGSWGGHHLGYWSLRIWRDKPPTGCCIIECVLWNILNSNVKTHSFLTSTADASWFWNFAQSTAVSLPYSGKNYKREGDLISYHLNTLRPRQNGRHFADDTFKCIFLNETFRISIKISLKFVPKGPINNIPALVQIMAWRRSGDKPLSEPMMVSLPTHIWVTRPQWVKWFHMIWV